ncbi:hypothetical protein Vafri_8398 [Volvox africanus]|nr:hypothetical protein Vafri_8398 [Volvox africanus]
MNSEDDSRDSIKLNPKVCALLQKPEPKQAATLPSRSRLKRLVGNAVVQRLRHENHKLAVEEFLREPAEGLKVSQEAALNYFLRRTYNSLQSREMIEKEAKDTIRLRREPFTQLLAKDISRRHLRTAQRYDTGSKYPDVAGKLNQHGPEARDPLLTLMQSRKLLAMADVLLVLPGSVRVGPQPSDAAVVTDRNPSSHNTNNLEKHEPLKWGSCSVPESYLVPSLDATRYALATFSPRSSHGSLAETGVAARRTTHSLRLKKGKEGSRDVADPVCEPNLTATDAGNGSAARQSNAAERAVSMAGIDDLPGAPPGRMQQGNVGQDVGWGDRETRDAIIPDGDAKSSWGREAQRNPSPTAALPVPTSDFTSPTEARTLGVYREEMPVTVQQRLLADKLEQLLAASRGLFAQVENVLGPQASSGALR